MQTEDLHAKLPNSEFRNKVGETIKNCPLEWQWLCWEKPNQVDKLIDDKIQDLKNKILDLENKRLICKNTISVMDFAKSAGRGGVRGTYQMI